MTTIDETHPAWQLIDVGRLLVRQGFVQASGGNLSVRDGENGMVITGTGTWLDRLRPDDLVPLTFDGAHTGGVRPSSEWLLHARIYAARPDVNSVIHMHPQYALLLYALGKQIRFITQDHAWYVGSYGHTPYHANGSDELADSAAEQLTLGHDVCLMGHHGIAAVGESVEWALRRAINFEEAATLTYRALALGDETATFPPDRLHLLPHH